MRWRHEAHGAVLSSSAVVLNVHALRCFCWRTRATVGLVAALSVAMDVQCASDVRCTIRGSAARCARASMHELRVQHCGAHAPAGGHCCCGCESLVHAERRRRSGVLPWQSPGRDVMLTHPSRTAAGCDGRRHCRAQPNLRTGFEAGQKGRCGPSYMYVVHSLRLRLPPRARLPSVACPAHCCYGAETHGRRRDTPRLRRRAVCCLARCSGTWERTTTHHLLARPWRRGSAGAVGRGPGACMQGARAHLRASISRLRDAISHC